MSSSKLRFLFIVQGEGRGHLTQALSLSAILKDAGHEVAGVLVGKSERRTIPDFFIKKIGSKVVMYNSPNYVSDSQNKSINITKSVFFALSNYKKYFESLKKIDSIVLETKPDIIINFFELLAGMYYTRYKPKIPMVCLGHQYLFNHPDFTFPEGHFYTKNASKLFVNMTANYATKKLALSFYPLKKTEKNNIVVVPPLLREDIYNIQTQNKDFILCYLLNDGYSQDIIEWQSKNLDTKIHCFYDKKSAPETEIINENLIFHTINDEKFINYMADCKGLVTSAGFESVCEAIYLGKPVLAIPTDGHYDQIVNAFDLLQTKAGITSNSYDFKLFSDYTNNYNYDNTEFKNWVKSGAEIFLKELENIF